MRDPTRWTSARQGQLHTRIVLPALMGVGNDRHGLPGLPHAPIQNSAVAAAAAEELFVVRMPVDTSDLPVALT
jgi:hypothetical protein